MVIANLSDARPTCKGVALFQNKDSKYCREGQTRGVTKREKHMDWLILIGSQETYQFQSQEGIKNGSVYFLYGRCTRSPNVEPGRYRRHSNSPLENHS